MNTGRFFKLDTDLQVNDGVAIFRYTKIFQEGHLPIYVSIDKRSISCYFSSKSGFINNLLFELHYSDHLNPKGKLSRQINELYKQDVIHLSGHEQSCSQASRERTELHYSTFEEFGFLRHNETTFGLKFLSLPEIFLDFLQDVNHSQVFKHSPYFDKLKSIIRENFLLNALSRKAELIYSQKWGIQGFDNQGFEKFLASAKLYQDILLNNESATPLPDSPWFLSDLEKEMDWLNGLLPKEIEAEEQLLYKRTLTNERVVTWYLERYDFVRIAYLLLQRNILYIFILFLPFTFLSIVLWIYFYFIDQSKESLSASLEGWPYLILYFNNFLIISTICYLLILVFHKIGREDPVYLPLQVISPRLLITLSLAWIGVEAILKKLGDITMRYETSLFAVLVFIFLPTYLVKRVREQAPDMSPKMIAAKVSQTLFIGFCYTLITGIIILPFLKVGDDINQLFDYVWENSLAIFFVGLFINTIFKDKPFTGL
jgi:hypothetical protein